MSLVEHIAYDTIMIILSISLIILGITLYFACKKKPVESEETLPVKHSAHAYPLTEIDVATNGFNHRRIIGKGRLGTVYAGKLEDEEVVAVKRIHPVLVLSNAGFGFSSVMKWLSLAQHPNVVPIIGFSEAPGVVLLELLSGRGCEGGLLVKWALPLIKDMRYSEVLDPKLMIPSNMKAIVRLAKVALACVETEVCLLSS
ncbi:hypothetical protein TSUD_385800 [Trifolium subterraneum]|uniref:Protein kinase domain-containing protein n=1 Tax=Trifolium subterraneum TaxID=3900 RepID=A0A2Z6MDW5_TRISU|nr:hypothetical protein TSUD_385800 [Trifolium subterraneum]